MADARCKFRDEGALFAGDGRVGAEDDQSGVNVRKKIDRGGGVSGEDGADAGRIDQIHAGGEQRRGRENFHAGHLLCVAWIFVFGNVRGKRGGIDREPLARGESYTRGKIRAVAQHGGHGCDGRDAGGKYRAADERVQPRCFDRASCTTPTGRHLSCEDYQTYFAARGITCSMSRRGDCWDNAPTESLCGSLKVARLHGRHFASRRAAMDEIVDWLGFYNSRRLHSTLDYVSPMTFEKNWFAAQQGRAA